MQGQMMLVMPADQCPVSTVPTAVPEQTKSTVPTVPTERPEEPRPPTVERLVKTPSGPVMKTVCSEVHECLSNGRWRPAANLSDLEFGRQYAGEVCYLARLGTYHLGKGVRHLASLVESLFT